jgi:hypothetical protein
MINLEAYQHLPYIVNETILYMIIIAVKVQKVQHARILKPHVF